jgi:hypothetical protein
MNTQNILFRASSIGTLMTNARSKSDKLSETTKAELLNVYIQEKYHRREEFSSKYTEKGIAVEADAIDIWRRLNNVITFKNNIRFKNEFVSGLPDLLVKDENDKVMYVPDIKSSWSLNTFYNSKINSIDKSYYWQGQVYSWLTNAQYAKFCYVLTNAPLQLIDDEKYRLSRRMNLIDPQGNKTFVEKAKQIERNMIYDMSRFLNDYPHANLETNISDWSHDIPIQQRIHEKIVEFDRLAIEELKERVPLWREYITDLDKIQ